MNVWHGALAVAAVGLCFAPHPARGLGALENPSNGGTESGITAITGWHCTSRNIELRIDGRSIGQAGSGTPRADTAATCGRSDTGFSFLYNYSLLRGGSHRIDAYADGQPFASSTFDVGYLGGEFLTGLAGAHELPYFPSAGSKARIEWSQSKQNFVITDVGALTGGSLLGTYDIRHVSVMSSAGQGASTLQPGLTVSGTWVFRAGGTYSMSMTLSNNGLAQSMSANGTYTDYGYYMLQDGAPLVIIERGETLTFYGMTNEGSTWMTLALGMTRSPSQPTARGDVVPMEAAVPAATGDVPSAIARALRGIAF